MPGPQNAGTHSQDLRMHPPSIPGFADLTQEEGEVLLRTKGQRVVSAHSPDQAICSPLV
eukprot:CAMPEP_0185789812 /NCGR_PEP_ID=MMETSP1174-20130828/152961_1 /TAXON_ID=35687 /ORGANISM="Dictyocha speculum, Strain CCMP1381" /LENGTH=58 /DNA_ID=CAMNT_0028484133 /DNA_START=124 /DNA_END=297 /DNA_ORIENTATION=+